MAPDPKSRCHIKPLKSAQVWYPFEKGVAAQAGSEGVCRAKRCEPHKVEVWGQGLQNYPREKEHCSALGATVKRHCFNIREPFSPWNCHVVAGLPIHVNLEAETEMGGHVSLEILQVSGLRRTPSCSLFALITQSAGTQNPPQKLSFSGVGRRHLVTVLGQPWL